jgi:cardiolipin synthase
VRCFVQPGEGAAPLVQAIARAKKSVEIVIFRFNRRDIEKALAEAVIRGVHVHALIAFTNRGGEQRLRDLEMRLLAAGVTVSRTDNDLVRYHGKLMIIDRRVLYLLAFNFTYLDMERTRSFGIATGNKQHVAEAVKLFDADTKRQPYSTGSATFIVSPVNARRQLVAFLQKARKELLIYDPEISDPEIMRILEARAKAGVAVRIIGSIKGGSAVPPEVKKSPMRLHTRTIVRDKTWAFVGSQSLRTLELDSRREVGLLFRDPRAVATLAQTFETDWETTSRPAAQEEKRAEVPAAKVAKRVAKAVAAELPPLQPVLEMTVRELGGSTPEVNLDHHEVEETVKQAVHEAVRQVVRDFVEEAVETQSAGGKVA